MFPLPPPVVLYLPWVPPKAFRRPGNPKREETPGGGVRVWGRVRETGGPGWGSGSGKVPGSRRRARSGKEAGSG